MKFSASLFRDLTFLVPEDLSAVNPHLPQAIVNVNRDNTVLLRPLVQSRVTEPSPIELKIKGNLSASSIGSSRRCQRYGSQ